jgi:hypothetical protein
MYGINSLVAYEVCWIHAALETMAYDLGASGIHAWTMSCNKQTSFSDGGDSEMITPGRFFPVSCLIGCLIGFPTSYRVSYRLSQGL